MPFLLYISANITQGSAIGSPSYVANASDLHALTDGNELCKYADNTYIIFPAVNFDSCTAELCTITDRACKNNLKQKVTLSLSTIGKRQTFLRPP